MDEKPDNNLNEGMEELKIFYEQKKREQDALRRLLEVLENAKNERADNKQNKN